MSPLETLSLVLGAGFASGLNVYATVATLGLLQRFGVIHLPEHLQVLSHPIVLAIAGVLYIMEFLADLVRHRASRGSHRRSRRAIRDLALPSLPPVPLPASHPPQTRRNLNFGV